MAGDLQPKPRPLAAFDPGEFAKVFGGLALDVQWFRRIDCPCHPDGDTLAFDPSCDQCAGTGHRYVDPLRARGRHRTARSALLRAVLNGAKGAPDPLREAGHWVNGEATVTVPQGIGLAWGDRLVSLEQSMAYSQRLLRGTAATVEVGYVGRTRQGRREALSYEPVAVEYVVDEDDAEYWPGEDFRLVESDPMTPAKFRWITGRGPASGKVYSIHYRCRPSWIVTQLVFVPQVLRGPKSGLKGLYEPRELPETYTVMLEHLPRAAGEA